MEKIKKPKPETLSILKFLKQFPDEDTCEKFIIAARFPRGIFCPNCGNYRIYRLETQKRYKCGKCKKQFTVRTGSVLAESKVSLQTWLMATWLLTSHKKGFSSIQLGKTLGVTQKTAWFLAHRIRTAFMEKKGGLLQGIVEADETYIGGKEKNKHADKKLNAGRGTVGKAIVMGVKERDGRLKSMQIADTTSETLHGIINKHVAKGSVVCTDDHRAYSGLLDYDHQVIKHSVGEYVRDMASTNGMESFWALLKRGFIGIYHQMSPAHLDRYVDEFSFRYNSNFINCTDVLSQVFYNSNGRRVTYKQLTTCHAKQ